MPDVDTLVVLTLEVEGADTDTLATATAYSPIGLEAPLVVAPADPSVRSRWTANLLPTTPGEWRVRWVVEGSGAGVKWDLVPVAPAPGAVGGRSYATTAQLAEHLDEAPPPGSMRALVRATRKVDELLRTAIYHVDDAGMPTDALVAEALAEATCAQVEWWDEIGDERGTGAVGALAGAQIGTVKLPASSGSGGGLAEYAAGAVAALERAGLVGGGPKIPGSRIRWRRQA